MSNYDKCGVTLVGIILLTASPLLASPGAVWNIRAAKSASAQYVNDTSSATANMLLAASEAFRMFGEIERDSRRPAVAAGERSIAFLQAAKQSFQAAKGHSEDVKLSDGLLDKVNYGRVEVVLGVPKGGAARTDWIQLVDVARTKGTTGLFETGQRSVDTLVGVTTSLMEMVKGSTTATSPDKLIRAIATWNRELQRGIYVSGIYWTGQ